MSFIRASLACCLGVVLGACAAAAPPPADRPPTGPTQTQAQAIPSDAVRWTIASARVPCVGVAPTTCLQYRDVPSGPWKNHYGPIEGFEFRSGFETDVLVRFVAVPRPPADAPSRRVVLVQELDRRAVMPGTGFPSALAGTTWRLLEMPGASGVDTPPAGPRGVPTLAFEPAGRVSGHAGVNRYGAGVVADATTLRVTNAFTTRMAGPPAAMALESAFLARLQQVAVWRIDGDRLRLSDAAGATLMILERAPRGAGA